MKADFRVVLDACVLANYAVADLLLRLAEKPRLYLPCWSERILEETTRTQIGDLNWSEDIAESFDSALRSSFPEAMMTQFEHLEAHCGNDEKDRHVLACAIHAHAEVILTFNLRDFQPDHLEPWGVSALHPQVYLNTLFDLEPLHVMQVLGAIAGRRRRSLEDHLIDLGRFLPLFSSRVLDEMPS